MKGGIIKNNFGYCSYSFEDDYVHVYNLFVYHKFRNQGKAREILQNAIDEIRKTSCMKIQIVADPKESCVNLEQLILFYKEMGFEVFTYYG